jgi:hypothetical protein
VLRRAPGELQVGLDAEAVIVDGASAGLGATIRLLDGCRSREEIVRLAGRAGVLPGEAAALLDQLTAASLVVEGRQAPRRTSSQQLRLVGAGALAKAVADLLAPHLGRLHLVDGDPTDRMLYPTAGALPTQAEALQAHLRHSAGACVSVWNHWSKPEGARLDLTLVSTAMVEPDRVVVDELLRTDQPHLVVRATGASGLVGPLVIPGTTACLGCTDLYRRDRDPAWPSLLTQLSRMRADPTRLVSSWVAAVAATQALSFLAGGEPETRGTTVELSARDHTTRWRAWPPHPACGCRWAGTAQ